MEGTGVTGQAHDEGPGQSGEAVRGSGLKSSPGTVRQRPVRSAVEPPAGQRLEDRSPDGTGIGPVDHSERIGHDSMTSETSAIEGWRDEIEKETRQTREGYPTMWQMASNAIGKIHPPLGAATIFISNHQPMRGPFSFRLETSTARSAAPLTAHCSKDDKPARASTWKRDPLMGQTEQEGGVNT